MMDLFTIDGIRAGTNPGKDLRPLLVQRQALRAIYAGEPQPPPVRPTAALLRPSAAYVAKRTPACSDDELFSMLAHDMGAGFAQ